MGLRASLDRCGKSQPTGIQSPDGPARRQSLYRLCMWAAIGKHFSVGGMEVWYGIGVALEVGSA